MPYITSESVGALDFWRARKVPVRVDGADLRVAQCSHAIALYASGESERKIAQATGLTAGSIQRLALDVAWVLEGLHRISMIGDINCPQGVSNQIAQLSRRVRWGVPSEALDLLRVSERQKVPGIGRQRAMELVRQGISTLQDVLYAGQKKLFEILKHPVRVSELLRSVATMTGQSKNHMEAAHLRVAEGLGVRPIVQRCYQEIGVEYEKAVLELLCASGVISASAVDDGVRQNVPDLLLKAGKREALVECKTASKPHGLIGKEDAWAVVQKASDFDLNLRRVTLGKPAFDETLKKKAAASPEVALVENGLFIEALLRVIGGAVTSEEFMVWLTTPGVAELERLPGKATYSS